MTKYKYVLTYPNGETYDSVDDGMEDLFDSYEDAVEAALYSISCTKQGAETLHMSNPGDYEYDEDTYEDPEYEIIEVDC